ncbi:hypothetical protein D1B31_23820 [Neobacillus notoginsengisoli]|uniref:Uncharacterized protein n=1 Tax=Neobacillus notoginsengisoli TaxID=1578198 RepID=A0A417YBT7_9BACI|nr:hypothetical protein [Neobacillus notoginsengisoli]RHW30150.1 hypothetical protein D1B31_23820 [Neobacillus notoginsengisoli]
MALIEEKHGAKPGEQDMIRQYQGAVSEFIKGLSVEELAEAEQEAQEWNTAKLPPKIQSM